MSTLKSRQRFVLFDPVDNHNKELIVEYYDDGTMISKNRRVGNSWVTNDPVQSSPSKLEAYIRSKTKKGYQPVDLFTEEDASNNVVAPISSDPKVHWFHQTLQHESTSYIKSYLASDVELLSISQINKGRDYLKTVISTSDKEEIVKAVIGYYNSIPTQLPLKLDKDAIVNSFIRDVHEQEERLNQLEQAISSRKPASLLAQLPYTTEWLDPTSEDYLTVLKYLRDTGGNVNVQEIYKVHIRSEREAFDRETRGQSTIRQLFHGTRSANVEHIVRSGLIIPQVAANASRFGRGIYFADQSRRSINYCSGRDHKILFLADVKLGNQKILENDLNSLREAPSGYDSVRGIKSYSGMDEFIIYKPSQQTIKYIVFFR